MIENFAQKAKDYKRLISNRFMLIDGEKIVEKINGEKFCVTKKLDGVMLIVCYQEGVPTEAYTVNGKKRVGIPCLDELGQLAKKAGLKSAIIAAEMYATLGSGRERVCDVSTAIANENWDQLFLAPFDIIEENEQRYYNDNYSEILARMNSFFSGHLVHPVEGREASSRHEVAEIYKEWVTDGGAEGIVVHSELPFIYKIKPSHSIDAAVIGYTIGDDDRGDMIRDLLVAVMLPDGTLQQFGATGTGMTDDQRRSLLERLQGMTAESEYIETDSRNVAFRMVRPEMVIELSTIDMVTENYMGEPKMNMLINYRESEGYKVVGRTPGVSVHNLAFERIREDKTANPTDIRISQITDIRPFAEGAKTATLTDLPTSEVLIRQVYVKGEAEKLAVRKFLVWKTNKEQTGLFPAYILHYTDFSASRANPLNREIRVSSSREQIMAMLDEMIAENIKKGWNKVD